MMSSHDLMDRFIIRPLIVMIVIKPLLKKKGLPLELKNYRPVSNLSFLSKILEKAAMNQINEHIESNKLLPAYQSAYRK